MMRAYEFMVIIHGDLEDTAARTWVTTISDQIAAAGGKVHGKPDWWGRRQFAYPIEKKEFGYYVVYNLLAPGGALDDLERQLRIADDIVRHKLLRLPDAEAARRGMAETAA
ncbi:MAG: 30S ribosomal protein S6 [Actinomycetota bacterium]|jgi:small subunit ribosomal protein S6